MKTTSHVAIAARICTTVFCGLLLATLTTATAKAEESPVDMIRGDINQDGRFEIFAVNSDGMLFHRWQDIEHTSWHSWVPNTFGNITDVATAKAQDGRLFVFVIAGGSLVIRSQQSANSGWGDNLLRLGHDLQRISTTTNSDGRIEVIALGGDKSIYSMSQSATNGGLAESDWVIRDLGGQNFRDVAASRDGNRRIVVFALGEDGRVHCIRQVVPNGSFGSWENLDGNAVQRISAARQAAGSLTVFALGGDSALYSRTQPSPDASWTAWVKVFDSPVKDWSATDNDSGLLEVAALWSPGIRVRIQARGGSYFPWISNVEIPQTGPRPPPRGGGSKLDPFIEKDSPVRSISLVRRGEGDLRMFAINDAGQVYTIERPADPRTSGTWAGKPWKWLGSPAFSPNEPDVVAQMNTCVERFLDANSAAEVYRIINDEVPGRIVQGTAGTPFASLAQNVSVGTNCELLGGNNWRETVGVWLGRQATPEILPTFNVIDAGHNFAYRINANTINRIFDLVWELQPKSITASGHTIQLHNKNLQFIDNPAPTPDQMKLSITGSGHELGIDIGFQATATANFMIADIFPL